MLRSLTSAAAALVLVGCGAITGADDERLVGQIGYPDRLAIEIPDTVQAGEAFSMTVQTYGPNGCWSGDGAEVSVAELSATVTPYDLKRDGTCTQMPVKIAHVTTLTFSQAGVAEILIEGRDGTAERSVVVE